MLPEAIIGDAKFLLVSAPKTSPCRITALDVLDLSDVTNSHDLPSGPLEENKITRPNRIERRDLVLGESRLHRFDPRHQEAEVGLYKHGEMER